MYPGVHGRERPDRVAVAVHETGESLTHGRLDDASARLAGFLRGRGVQPGETLAIVMENRVEHAIATWAGMRSGVFVAPVARTLAPPELEAALALAAPAALVVGAASAAAVRAALGQTAPRVRLAVGAADGFEELATATAESAPLPIADERSGSRMIFSSGSTGRPKAMRLPLGEGHPAEAPARLGPLLERLGIGPDTVLLSPAPLHHAASFSFTLAVQAAGGTVVLHERFDAARTLEAVERHRATHALLVPTMLRRLLRLDTAMREAADLSSLRVAITGAAPCPPELKHAILQWWGPVLHEYYGASEGYGQTHIGPQEMRLRPESVGRAVAGTLHVTDADGRELAAGEIGRVWFEGAAPIEYSGDPQRSAQTRDERGWNTIGDRGWLDPEGYLHLTGREGFTIVTGGVNVEPEEVESALESHPSVEDVAVLGAPDDDLGERIVALVKAPRPVEAESTLVAALLDHAAARLARHKLPRELLLVDELPRLETGKLARASLPEAYAVAGRRSRALL